MPNTTSPPRPLNRRRFLHSGLAAGAGALLAPRLGAMKVSQRASVLDFGADPTGQRDSTAAVRKAIASLHPASARVVFPAGKYTFAPSDEPVLSFHGFDGIEVYANNGELRFAGTGAAFSFTSCRNVALHDTKIDWDIDETAAAAPDADLRAIVFDQCEGVQVEGINVVRSPGVAFAPSNCRGVGFENVFVAPGKDARARRSSEGHAIRVADCHGGVHVEDCHFDSTGGDAIHMFQSYWRIRERLDPRAVTIESAGPAPLDAGQLPRAGDFIQFTSPETLQLLGEIAVRSVSIDTHGATLNFAETLSPVIVQGVLLCSVVDAPKVVISHCTVNNTAGNGLVLHARTEVTNSRFTNCAGAAIVVAADVRRGEGPSAQSVNIGLNTFEACNQGAARDERGVIVVDTAQHRDQPETPRFKVNGGIKVQGNIFKRTAGAAIYAAGVDGLVIESNTFTSDKKAAGATSGATAAVVLKNVADARITGNTASVPQSIQLTQCADSVATDGNRLLTAQTV